MHHPTDRITHTTAFVTPVVEHWLKKVIGKYTGWIMAEFQGLPKNGGGGGSSRGKSPETPLPLPRPKYILSILRTLSDQAGV